MRRNGPISDGAKRIAATLLFFVAGSGAANAQVLLTDDAAKSGSWQGRIEARFLNEFDTKTDGGDEFNAWRVSLEGGGDAAVHESFRIGLRAAYQHASYDFHLDNSPNLPPGYGGSELPREPWGGVNTIDVAPTASALFGGGWSLEAAVPIRYSGETGARRNGLAAGITGLLRWRALDTLALGAGVGVTSQLEGPAQVFPVIALDWKITPRLDLRTQGNFVQGGQVVLLWGPAEAVRLTVSAGYERNRFRLDDNGSSQDRHGIGEISSVPVEVGARIQLFEGGFLDFRAGFGFAGRIRVENANGHQLYEENYDPVPRLGLALSFPLGGRGSSERISDTRRAAPWTHSPSVVAPDAPPALP